MTQLIIKSENTKAAVFLIQAAIRTQMGVIATGIKRTKDRLASFEEQYRFSTQQILEQEQNGDIDDNNLDMIEWLGEFRMLERLDAEYQELAEVEICS